MVCVVRDGVLSPWDVVQWCVLSGTVCCRPMECSAVGGVSYRTATPECVRWCVVWLFLRVNASLHMWHSFIPFMVYSQPHGFLPECVRRGVVKLPLQ